MAWRCHWLRQPLACCFSMQEAHLPCLRNLHAWQYRAEFSITRRSNRPAAEAPEDIARTSSFGLCPSLFSLLDLSPRHAVPQSFHHKERSFYIAIVPRSFRGVSFFSPKHNLPKWIVNRVASGRTHLMFPPFCQLSNASIATTIIV